MDLFKPSVKHKACLTAHFHDSFREDGESCGDDVEGSHECTGCDECWKQSTSFAKNQIRWLDQV
jgi:hypothetical protein